MGENCNFFCGWAGHFYNCAQKVVALGNQTAASFAVTISDGKADMVTALANGPIQRALRVR